jgi:UDP-N-acetylglucosamine acyltransferase
MAYCHIGHNCTLGDGITMANMVGIAGHVQVEDRVGFGGFVGIHQFVRVGKFAMVGGYSKVLQDIPPFMLADGRPAKVLDLNVIGLRRSGVSAPTRADLKQAYKMLYRSEMNLSQALETIDSEIEPSPERDYLLEFMSKIRLGSNGRQNDAPRG